MLSNHSNHVDSPYRQVSLQVIGFTSRIQFYKSFENKNHKKNSIKSLFEKFVSCQRKWGMNV